MKRILECEFDFILENKYSITTIFLEPIPISDKHQIRFEVANRIPLNIEVTFSDENKNYFLVKLLPTGLETLSNVDTINATKMVVRTDIKAVVIVKVSK